jgi:bifunctional non-homologous end joining protein LigD
MGIEGVMQTPDGVWRVEAVRQGRHYWYRLRHGDEVFEPLSVAALDHVLSNAGVDRATLVPVDPAE